MKKSVFPIGAKAKTIALVGRTGSGKSATGNSIIGAKAFDTMPSSAGGTTICQLQRALVDDGQILDVIDTPGFCGSSLEPEFIDKCINMAKDGGIHAFLVVVSVDKSHFSAKEASAIKSLKQVFGDNIGDYMIVVFTHGDTLPKTMSLDDFLAVSCPDPLEEILKTCGNRHVLFDNVTEDEVKKSRQRKELLRLVDEVVDNNGGIPFTPFTNELFAHSSEVSEYGEKFNEAYEEQLKLFVEKSESKIRERTLRLEKQLGDEKVSRIIAEAKLREVETKLSFEINTRRKGLEKQLADEQVSRIIAEAKLREVQAKSSFEINMLRKDLDSARREAEELRETHKETNALLKETKEKLKETEDIFKETEQNFAVTKEKFKETEEVFKEMEQNFAVKFKETEKNLKITEEEDWNYIEEYKCRII